jgi:hypothetical protein
MRALSARRYLLYLCVIVLASCTGTLLLNCVVDPLWYFNGNMITGKNFAFNERVAKINQFLKNPERYDCFMFGSSRSTLLDAGQIEGYNCYNFSFSDGRIGEYIAYASYLKRRGFYPKLVIVGVDNFVFQRVESKMTVPEFIEHNTEPRSFISSYLSLDALAFSIRTLLGLSPGNIYRYYAADFSPGILPNAPAYQPEEGYLSMAPAQKTFYPRKARAYKRMTKVYPDAHFVFYVPPVSPQAIRRYAENGVLDDYLQCLYAVSRLVPVLYDFSIPSFVTADTRRTYDGSHYDLDTNGLIAKTINTGDAAFGLKVNRLTFDTYRQRYLDATTSWSTAGRGIEPRLSHNRR